MFRMNRTWRRHAAAEIHREAGWDALVLPLAVKDAVVGLTGLVGRTLVFVRLVVRDAGHDD